MPGETSANFYLQQQRRANERKLAIIATCVSEGSTDIDGKNWLLSKHKLCREDRRRDRELSKAHLGKVAQLEALKENKILHDSVFEEAEYIHPKNDDNPLTKRLSPCRV